MWWNNHVGFGILFRFERKTGKVIVESRLLNSPAADAGLVRYEELLAYNGHSMIGRTSEEQLAQIRAVRVRRVGETARLTFKRVRNGAEEIFDAEMTAVRIWGTIPDYSDYLWPDDDDGRFRIGFCIDRRTGYFVPTVRLSKQALDRIFFNP